MRPNFLTSPGVWMRTPRHAASPVDNACAITVYQAVHQAQRFIWGGVIILLAVLAGVYTLSRFA